MKIPEAFKTDGAQHTFQAALIVFLLLVLPLIPLGKCGGGIAMLAGAIVGGMAYFLLYGERLRSRGKLKIVALAAAAAVLVAFALALVLRELLASLAGS